VNRRRAKAFAFLAVVIGFLTLSTVSAFAHAQLINTYPAANSIQKKSPTQITLTWGEKVQTNSDEIVLADATGSNIATTFTLTFDAVTHESTAKLVPAQTLVAGSYIVSWRAVSLDGHLVGGAYSFGVNQKPTLARNSALISYPDKVLQFIFWSLTVFSFAAILAGSYFLFVIASFLIIVISGLRILIISSLLPTAYLQSGSAKISLLAILVYALLLMSSIKWVLSAKKIEREERLSKVGLAQLLAIALLFASQELFEGHALDLAHPLFLRYIAAGHLFFAIAWAGSVGALLLRQETTQFELTRKINIVSVFALIALASTLTFYLARPISLYGKSNWVLLFALKVLLILICLTLGAFHHFASKNGAIENDYNFKRTLIFEVGTFAAILAATVSLVSFSPPKILSLEKSNSTKAAPALSQVDYQIPLTFDNGMKGTLSIPHLTLGSPSPISIDLAGPRIQQAKTMYIYFSNSALNLTDIQVTLSGSKNHYSSQLLLPAKGTWHLDIQILLDPFTEAQAQPDILIN
jgi:methionine-rich copper-binding protein CopC